MKLYRAVVEDNLDPLEIGRVRVRIFGLHTANNENSKIKFNFISSSELPWAEVMGGTEFGLVGGIGLSSVLLQGTWVWCTLEENNPNKPVIIGTITGISKTRPKYSAGEGFNDKDEINPFIAREEESDINRLARAGKLNSPNYDNATGIYGAKDTIHKQINDHVDIQTGITDAVSTADVSQTEPNSLSNNTVYPNASVLETTSGHVFEFDDTTGNERVRLYHRSGSYIEVRPDGTFVQKSVGTSAPNHYIHMSDVNEHIAKGVKRYIETNLEEIISGGIKKNVKMDFLEHINGFFQITADGNLEIVNDVKITGKLEVTSSGKFGADLVTTGGEITDKLGNLSSLRSEHDKNVTVYNAHTHIGNLGIPTAVPDVQENPDPKVKASVSAWIKHMLGFR